MQTTRKPYHKHRWLTALSLSILVAVALYLVVLVSADASQVADAARRLPLAGWGAILGLSLLNYGLRFARWHLYLRALGHALPAPSHALIYCSGFALTTTPGKAGEAIRSLYLHDRGVPYAHSLAALFSERLIDLLAMLALAGVGVVGLGLDGRWVAIAGLAGVILVIVMRSPRALDVIARWPMPHPRLAHWRNHFVRLLQASATLLRVRWLVAAVLLGVLSWGAEGIGLHLVTQALALPATPAQAVGIYALAMLGGAASFVPGGLGGAEAVMAGLLVALGAPLPQAIAATLICRAATLWFAILLGMATMALLQARNAWRATST